MEKIEKYPNGNNEILSKKANKIIDIFNIKQKIVIAVNWKINLMIFILNGKIIGRILFKGKNESINKIIYIENTNTFGKKINNLGIYMIEYILIHYSNGNLVIKDILDDTLEFYKKICKYFIEQNLIKDFKFIDEDLVLIKK